MLRTGHRSANLMSVMAAALLGNAMAQMEGKSVTSEPVRELTPEERERLDAERRDYEHRMHAERERALADDQAIRDKYRAERQAKKREVAEKIAARRTPT